MRLDNQRVIKCIIQAPPANTEISSTVINGLGRTAKGESWELRVLRVHGTT